jgi:hypothetical protein
MNRTPNNNDFTYNIDGDSIEGGIEGILKAFFPNMVSRVESKSTDRPKLVKFGFDEYRIKYFTKKTDDGFQCHINLSNVPTKDKSCVAKNITLKYIPKNKLMIGFYYSNIYIEDTLVLEQKITSNTVLKYHQTKNDILVISFKK